jgi:hypothetical protein
MKEVEPLSGTKKSPDQLSFDNQSYFLETVDSLCTFNGGGIAP